MALDDDLLRVAQLVASHGDVSGVLAAEPLPANRFYLVSFGDAPAEWLVVRDDGTPVTERDDVRSVASLVAMCELAADVAGGGDITGFRAHLAELRAGDPPQGLEDVDEAAARLERTVGTPPRIASPALLDEIGAATAELERALGDSGSPFAQAVKAGAGAVDEFAADVVRGYKLPLG